MIKTSNRQPLLRTRESGRLDLEGRALGHQYHTGIHWVTGSRLLTHICVCRQGANPVYVMHY